MLRKTDDDDNGILNVFFVFFTSFQRLCLAGTLKWVFRLSGMLTYFIIFTDRFPMQLALHTGSGFKGFTYEGARLRKVSKD